MLIDLQLQSISHQFHNQQLNVPALTIAMGQIRRWIYDHNSIKTLWQTNVWEKFTKVNPNLILHVTLAIKLNFRHCRISKNLFQTMGSGRKCRFGAH